MDIIPLASNVLALCYPLTCNSEDYASNALATELHLRREEKRRGKAPTPPSQGKVSSVDRTRQPDRVCAAWEHGACTVLASCLSGAGIAPLSLAGLSANAKLTQGTLAKLSGTVSTGWEARHALA